jgi:hypothetical protein
MRSFAVCAASLVSALAAAAPTAPPRPPWMSGALTADPSEIAHAARLLPTPANADRQILLDERIYRFRPDGTLDEMSQRRVPAELHTLASVEAELGKSLEAYATLLEAIDNGTGEPRPEDFYVLGRIAENVGLPDVALAEYRKVLAVPIAGAPNQFRACDLAQRRMRALTASK